MPLWLIYGCDYIMAIALLVMAAFLVIFYYLVVTRRIRLLAVDSPLKGCPGKYVTEYLLVIGEPGEIEVAVSEWAGKGEARG